MLGAKTAIPILPDEILATSISAIFAIYLVTSLIPKFSLNKKRKITAALISINFVPMIVLSYAHVFESHYLTGESDGFQAFYFSVVTFTTLGYGDIQPVDNGRIFAMLEAVSGFLFVPLLVSQLVGISQIAEKEHDARIKEQKRLDEQKKKN